MAAAAVGCGGAERSCTGASINASEVVVYSSLVAMVDRDPDSVAAVDAGAFFVDTGSILAGFGAVDCGFADVWGRVVPGLWVAAYAGCPQCVSELWSFNWTALYGSTQQEPALFDTVYGLPLGGQVSATWRVAVRGSHPRGAVRAHRLPLPQRGAGVHVQRVRAQRGPAAAAVALPTVTGELGRVVRCPFCAAFMLCRPTMQSPSTRWTLRARRGSRNRNVHKPWPRCTLQRLDPAVWVVCWDLTSGRWQRHTIRAPWC